MADSSFLGPALIEYVHRLGLREPPELAQVRSETKSMREAGFLVAKETGLLLVFLLELIGAKRSLDVGTFTGYSSLAAALAMGPDGHVITFDKDEKWTAIAQRHWREARMESRIELRLGAAEASLAALISDGQAESFDFAFIDADKAMTATYVESCLRLLRPGGLIAIDNVLWKGAVAAPSDQHDTRTKALHELNMRLRDDERISLILLPIGDGLTLLRKRTSLVNGRDS